MADKPSEVPKVMRSSLGDTEVRQNRLSEFFNEPNFESESSSHLKYGEGL